MKNVYKTNIFGAILSIAVMSGTCAAGGEILAGGGKTKLPAEVSEIQIEAGNMVSITVVRTADIVGAAEVRGESKAEKPVSIERQGTKLMIRVSGSEEVSRPRSSAAYSSLKLYLPQGRNLTVLGQNLVLSGELAAKNLTVKATSVSMHALKISASEDVSVEAGYGQLKFKLDSARKLTVKADKASGKITLPVTTALLCPEREGLQIVRADGAKKAAK